MTPPDYSILWPFPEVKLVLPDYSILWPVPEIRLVLPDYSILWPVPEIRLVLPDYSILWLVSEVKVTRPDYSIISVIGKILDWVILIKERHVLKSSNLQFRFKSNLSTTQCTFCMMETVNYYNFNRSNVYVLLLDATNAFDRVK